MKRLFVAIALACAAGMAAAATPQSPALDGPFSVPTAWTTQTVGGQPVQVPTAFSDNHWNTTPSFYASCPAIQAYLDASRPLARVWAGDSPQSPANTVPLVFPDVATAETILLGCGATEPAQ